ncbi:type IV secretory system conjugative DNA transfer family protein [Catenulispora pinisilvae]|uniref:type IV secretory system conjugative DNA transfer family protein n=1 Tax=Catenulispora pinisilvae TaxID=2705253 RepID=UPI001891F987|nr:DUF87 domain-containing protein [Catenulispora pinisilvae]
MVERAIEAAWPGAQTETVLSAGAPVPTRALAASKEAGGVSELRPVRAVGGRLRLARPEIHPLQDRFSTDPLRALLGACTDLGAAEYACVQVLARPAAGRRLRRFRRTLRGFHKAPTSRTAAKTTLFDLTTRGPRGRTTAVRADLEHSAELRAAMTKSVGPLWETAIHYAVVTTAPVPSHTAERRSEAGRLRGLAHALASAFAVHAERNWWARKRMPHLLRAVAERRFLRGELLNLTELAAIAHLPYDTDAPGVSRAGAKSAAAPPSVVHPSRSAKPLGRSDVGGSRPVGLAVADARHHLHIVGKTGSGKSSLLANLILSDIEAGRGAVVIDPKGDLVSALLDRLPDRAVGRTVLIDPERDAIRPAMNVMGIGNDQEIPLVVDNLVSIFHKIYGAYWGPRTDDILRSVTLTLLKNRSDNGSPTLADIPGALLSGDVARLSITAGLRDPMLTSFWDWYAQLSDGARAQVVGPLMNKLRAFLLRDFVRQTVAASTSNFDMADVLNGGVLLARLPKGILGEETTRLLGSLIVAGVWRAAQARARQAEDQRRDSSLYLDEGQNFLTLAHPLEDMFAEARAYRLSIAFAHQNLGQLSTELREALSANARSKIYFNASPEDSRLMERHTVPTLSAYDLAHLGGYQVAARLVCGGQETRAFTLKTQPMPAAVSGRADAVLDAAAERWPAVSEVPMQRLAADPRAHRSPAPGLADTLELELDPQLLRNEGGEA